MTALHRLSGGLSSLRLTVWCLAAAFVLVFAGTLAQVNHGLYFIQEQYFQSWFIKWSLTPDGIKIPVFPGGHLIGAVLLVNLIAAHIRRFSWSWSKCGIQLTHLGLILMLAGGLATDLFSVSSYMRLKEGETKNYSEDSTRMELAVAEEKEPPSEQVTAVPGERLAEGGAITHESLPFKMVIKGFFRNSNLQMIGDNAGSAAPASSMGAGARISIKSLPRTTKLNDRDMMSAVLEIISNKDGKSLGTWLVSAEMDAAQTVEVDGRRWSLLLRAARYYKPYSLSLIDFTHETYPGTQTPKNFSSKVTLTDIEHNESRQVQIFMNHPLRYLGDTYYQSGFDADNSGTILQVVRNPGGGATYLACTLMTLGLLFQFLYHLTRFARRAQPVTAP